MDLSVARMIMASLLVLSIDHEFARAQFTFFEGTFVAVIPDGPNPVVSPLNSNTLAWGDPGAFGVGPSSVAYDEYTVFNDDVLSGMPFRMGHVSYFNGTIEHDTGINGAVMQVTLVSDDFDLEGQVYNLDMITESTPNRGTPDQRADYLFFNNGIDDSLLPAFFYVHEGSDAAADIWGRFDFIPFPVVPAIAANASATGDALGAPAGEYVLRILGFENVVGDGFLAFEPIAVVPEPSGLTLAGVIIATALAARRLRLQ